jgi:hypothetical protein
MSDAITCQMPITELAGKPLARLAHGKMSPPASICSGAVVPGLATKATPKIKSVIASVA